MKKFLLSFVVCFLVSPLVAATLKPENVDQFFVEPGIGSNLSFTVEGDGDVPTEFKLLDAVGKPVEGKKIFADFQNRSVKITDLVLPQGFWELQCGEQRFGVVSLPPFKGERDKFYAIDAAMSWLVLNDPLREGLVRVARRVGIGMIRERVNWSQIEPEEGKFDFETSRRYEKLRKYIKENEIEVQELFHDAPGWTQKIEKYPGDLVKTAKSWKTIADRWQSTWGALEIWNEPDISFGAELPADQYVPIARTISYRYKTDGVKPPLFGGVMAHCNLPWLRCAAENGLLDVVDGFSFHTYGRAPSMEKLVADYRDWLIESGHESMPLWLTECGRPWKRGTERPGTVQDMTSAVDITMKGVESLCCGVDRYFPFVYPYYDERESNFGMMDKLGTPCRSMAAYAQMIRVLSHVEYVGDWKHDEPAIIRARVFQGKTGTVVVLYTGDMKEPKKIKLPAGVERIESLTGTPIVAPNGELTLESTSLYYVTLGSAWAIEKNTEAMRLYQSTRKPTSKKIPAPNPLVLRFEYDKERFSATPDGYFVAKTDEKSLTLKIKAFNLSDKAKDCVLRLDGVAGSDQKISVPAQGNVEAALKLPLDSIRLETGQTKTVRVTAIAQESPGMTNLVFSLRGEATWDGATSTAKTVTELSVNDLARWRKNIAGIGQMEMTTPDEDGAVWRMKATFKDGDRWVYPRFKLPEDIDLTKYSGVLLHARAVGDVRPGLFLFEKEGSGYIVQPAFVSDGKWHVVKLPFEKFGFVTATRPDPNGKLDLDRVDHISLGGNSKQPDCTLEIRKLALYKE